MKQNAYLQRKYHSSHNLRDLHILSLWFEFLKFTILWIQIWQSGYGRTLGREGSPCLHSRLHWVIHSQKQNCRDCPHHLLVQQGNRQHLNPPTQAILLMVCFPENSLHWKNPSSSFFPGQPNAERPPTPSPANRSVGGGVTINLKGLSLTSGHLEHSLSSHLTLWRAMIVVILQKRKQDQRGQETCSISPAEQDYNPGRADSKIQHSCYFSPPPKRGRNMLRLKVMNKGVCF